MENITVCIDTKNLVLTRRSENFSRKTREKDEDERDFFSLLFSSDLMNNAKNSERERKKCKKKKINDGEK